MDYMLDEPEYPMDYTAACEWLDNLLATDEADVIRTIRRRAETFGPETTQREIEQLADELVRLDGVADELGVDTVRELIWRRVEK